jgi:TIR domain
MFVMLKEFPHHADQLQRVLETAGIPVWRDTADLRPRQAWRTNIRRAITNDALVFLACFSQQSLSRSKSYQNEELLLAIEQLRLRPPGTNCR